MRLLYLECYPDEKLVTVLGKTRKQFEHAGDIGGVCTLLRKHTGRLGLTDEDPGKPHPTYLKNLTFVSEHHRIKVLTDPQRDNLVLVICPRLEEWVVWMAQQNDLDLKRDFGIPARTGPELHSVINQYLPKFEKSIQRLLQMQAQPLLHLKMLLQS
ncbi:MAG: hypothetical protein LH606_20645 [Cytophagaceae bacterium]|nr:hypothetical protein [Cytophagaceae bacterium]